MKLVFFFSTPHSHQINLSSSFFMLRRRTNYFHHQRPLINNNHIRFCSSTTSQMDKILWDNRAIRQLPIDRESRNFIRPKVPRSVFSMVVPTPLARPKVVVYSKSAMKLLGIKLEDPDIIDDATLQELSRFFSGNDRFSGSNPYSHCYAGHQFGSFAGQLGDGAAIALGEVVAPIPPSEAPFVLDGFAVPPSSLLSAYSENKDNSNNNDDNHHDEKKQNTKPSILSGTIEELDIAAANAIVSTTIKGCDGTLLLPTSDVSKKTAAAAGSSSAPKQVSFSSANQKKKKEQEEQERLEANRRGNRAFLETPHARWEVQLKGAGLTPYSRSADGRKVLRSSLREFLASEAIFALNIPTTRAGVLVVSTDTVERDPMYTGKVITEPCAVCTRISPNFIRFGSFEICKPGDEDEGERQGPSAETGLDPAWHLFEYVAKYYFPREWKQAEIDKKTRVQAAMLGSSESSVRAHAAPHVFKTVVRSTARLVAHWQCVGFVHGVLNTDNMSILGLTIDYGPYQFMEFFDKDFVGNASDHGGRYCYENQPEICKWNCLKLMESFMLMFPETMSMGSSLSASASSPTKNSMTEEEEMIQKEKEEKEMMGYVSSIFDEAYQAERRNQLRAKLFGVLPEAILPPAEQQQTKEEANMNRLLNNRNKTPEQLFAEQKQREYEWQADLDEVDKLLFETFQETAADFTKVFAIIEKIQPQMVTALTHYVTAITSTEPGKKETLLRKMQASTEEKIQELSKELGATGSPSVRRKTSNDDAMTKTSRAISSLLMKKRLDEREQHATENSTNTGKSSNTSLSSSSASFLRSPVDATTDFIFNTNVCAPVETRLQLLQRRAFALRPRTPLSAVKQLQGLPDAQLKQMFPQAPPRLLRKEFQNMAEQGQKFVNCQNRVKELQARYGGSLEEQTSKTSKEVLERHNVEQWLNFLRVFEKKLRACWLRNLPEHFTVSMLNAELDRRQHVLSMSNPRFVLRNWVAQKAIDAAENHGDYALVHNLLQKLENPFEDLKKRKDLEEILKQQQQQQKQQQQKRDEQQRGGGGSSGNDSPLTPSSSSAQQQQQASQGAAASTAKNVLDKDFDSDGFLNSLLAKSKLSNAVKKQQKKKNSDGNHNDDDDNDEDDDDDELAKKEKEDPFAFPPEDAQNLCVSCSS